MKILAEVNRKNGKTMTQIRRTANVVLVRVDRDTIGHVGYEVMRVKSHDGYQFMGRPVPASEFLPSDEDWGQDGFTYGLNALDHAEARFALLLDEDAQPKPPKDAPRRPVSREESKTKFILKLKKP
jgi:hypothetical protein